MPRIAVQLFNHSSGQNRENRSLLKLSDGSLHRFLTDEVNISAPVGRDNPFLPTSRHIRFYEGRVEVTFPEAPDPDYTFVDLEIILYSITQTLSSGVRYQVPRDQNAILRVRLGTLPSRTPAVQQFVHNGRTENGDLHRLILGIDSTHDNLPTVWVDVTFMDVTEQLRNLQLRLEQQAGLLPLSRRRPLEQHAFRLKPLKREFISRSRAGQPVDVSESEQIKTRVLEYTAGIPSGWVVCLPTNLPEYLSRVGILLFYRPTISDYTNPEEMDLERVFRYYRVPPNGFPWFIGPQPLPNPTTTVMPQLVATPNPCGWLRQLSQAQTFLSTLSQGLRNAPICVNPIPHGSSYGQAATFTSVRHILPSILPVLAGQGIINTHSPATELINRIAISGFSAGGLAMFSLLREFLQSNRLANRGMQIDEVYCFDPVGFNQNQGVLESWFRGNSNRILRLFAGNLQVEMHALFNRINSIAGNRISLRPNSFNFWRSSLYQDALSIPLHTRPNRTPYQQCFDDFPDGFRPTLQIKVNEARHQWTVGGGEGSSIRDERFLGYLNLALRESGF